MTTAVGIIERRVNGLGVSEAEVQTQGDRHIIVNIPKGTNSKQARDQVGTTAQLALPPGADADPGLEAAEAAAHARQVRQLRQAGEPGGPGQAEREGEADLLVLRLTVARRPGPRRHRGTRGQERRQDDKTQPSAQRLRRQEEVPAADGAAAAAQAPGVPAALAKELAAARLRHQGSRGPRPARRPPTPRARADRRLRREGHDQVRRSVRSPCRARTSPMPRRLCPAPRSVDRPRCRSTTRAPDSSATSPAS